MAGLGVDAVRPVLSSKVIVMLSVALCKDLAGAVLSCVRSGLIDVLRSQCRVIRVDLRGNGKRRCSPQEISCGK